jgi:sugar/nucleoside kinase (ribokinase family)/beta-phosphoglucomutase-like phosphatase (HAD superfamily)
MENNNNKILIFGDLAIDLAYHTSPSNKISLETEQKIDNINSINIDGAASSNIALNLKALNIDTVDMLGIVGDDFLGQDLIKLLKNNNIGTQGIIVQKENWATLLYNKFYNSFANEYYRSDSGSNNKISPKNKESILNYLDTKLNNYDYLIINNQFNENLFDESFFKKLQAIIDKTNTEVFLDTRSSHLPLNNINLKINQSEAKLITNKDSSSDILEELYKQTKKPVIVTKGDEGAIGYDGKDIFIEKGIQLVHETDTVGAGDAFLAGFIYAKIQKESFSKGLTIANVNASISCEILNKTGHPTLKELNNNLHNIDYRYNPEIALDDRNTNYYENTEIEIINPNVIKNFNSFPEIAIFDHDGTLSTMRQSWEKIMSKMMAKAILEDSYDLIDSTMLKKITEDVDSLIEKTTGIQTILQMADLIKLIKKYKYVEDKDIKTPAQYKASYKVLLNDGLKRKYELFELKHLNVKDLTIKDAIKTLKYFKDKGVTNYLASGSDKDDVEKEVVTFGYANYFDGGIFGSVGDINHDPKKKVMKDIISKVEGKNVVVFGDGPVEMREGKKNNFLTIGLVSNEQQRFGINPAKRERLILAGADILIPDFSWIDKLGKILGWI